MADGNGKSKTFAGMPSWESGENATDFSKFATQQDIINYVQNAFVSWHHPHVQRLEQCMKVLDTMLLFLQERGMEVKDGRVYLTPSEIQVWADQRQAAEIAAQTPKDQQA